MANQKDLFDDSVMTFGEHLEALRFHLIRALMGLTIGVVLTLLAGEAIVKVIRQPIDAALARHSKSLKGKVTDNVEGFNFLGTVWETIKGQFVLPTMEGNSENPSETTEQTSMNAEDLQRSVTLALPAYELVQQLHQLVPEAYPAPPEGLKSKYVELTALSDDVGAIRRQVKKIDDPITLNVQEAFLTYVKVSLISGLVLTSPWIFYQLWLFVAAGLYPHERKYVYTYLPMSLGLFLGGAAFCFYVVFPWVLDFLLSFNARMNLTAQIRISEWISFAVLLPLLFGLSFQLPMVMLFLQKINIFRVEDYRERRRIAVLVIAFLSMVLTPSDPASMLLMMVPLCVLYELGILLCVWTQDKAEIPLPA